MNYKGKFINEKRLCSLGCLGKYGEDVMIWLFPIQAFNAFNKIFILTYMFHAQIQKYYYDFFKLTYTYLHVTGNDIESYSFSEESSDNLDSESYESLIHICENEKLNQIGDRTTDLSKSWYIRNCQNENFVMKKLKDNLYNYFRNVMKSPSSNNLWTCFKDFKKQISGKGYGQAYIPSNSRATNNYRTRTVLAYPINKYLHTYIKNFFIQNGIMVDEDGYALSEMLQWIWRSAIRDGEEIWIYIPSSRMRNILKQWIRRSIGNEKFSST